MKLKSVSLLKMFCRPSFVTVLCKSMTLLIMGLLAIYKLVSLIFTLTKHMANNMDLAKKKKKVRGIVV